MSSGPVDKSESSEISQDVPVAAPDSNEPEINLLDVYHRVMSSLDLQEVVVEITSLGKKC